MLPAALVLALQLAGTALPAPQDTVTLLLRYDHQFQFAGYYVAAWEGLYRARGIEVIFKPAITAEGRQREVGPLLAEGQGEFGIMGADALTHIAAGRPLVLLAPIFQRSPVAAFVRADATAQNLADVRGLVISVAQADVVTVEVLTALAAVGLPTWTLNLRRASKDTPVMEHFENFAQRRFDVYLGIDFSVPWMARTRGVPIRKLGGWPAGVSFYGDALFTTRGLVEKNPKLVTAFVEASLEGWRRALANGPAVAARIAREFPRTIPVDDAKAYNEFLIPRVQEAVLYPVVPLGTNKIERWNHMAVVLYGNGLLPRQIDMADHVFDPAGERARKVEQQRRTAIIGGLALLAALIVIVLVLLMLRHRERERRLRLELKLQEAVKLESLGRLAGGVAHDFNNMLTAIRGHAAILEADLVARGEPNDDAKEIVRAADRATELVRQLLTFGRRRPGNLRNVDAAQVARGLERMLRRLIPARIAFRLETSAEPVVVRIDPNHLEQVMMNLVLNAADAIEEAGTIVLSIDVWQDQARIGVRDDGIGMTPDVATRVFEPFFTTKREGEGTGLGLATTHGIVVQSGGEVAVESEPGVGTTFRVLLPLAAGGLPAPEPDVVAHVQQPTAGQVVLVVEDEPAVRNIACRILLRAGYTVLEAEHGRAALDVIASHNGRIDLMVTDTLMPVMGGHELVREVAARYPDLSTVITSGNSQVESKIAEIAQVRAFLPKPYGPESLLRVVGDALNR